MLEERVVTLQIELRSLDTLQTNEANPKAHTTQLIATSLTRFGVIDPIVIDSRTDTVISGHGRLKAFQALKAAGGDIPDGVKVEGEKWIVPVVTGWESKSDIEARAALVALNKANELGGWDEDRLLELLEDLSEFDGGFDGVGFDELDIEALKHLSYSHDDGPRNLDDLYEDVGGVTDEDSLVRVAVMLPKDTAEEFRTLLTDDPKRHRALVEGWLE